MNARRLPLAAGMLAAASLTVVACSESGSGKNKQSAQSVTPAIGRSASFPSTKNKSLGEIVRPLGPGPILATTGQDFVRGRNRFGFVLFTRSQKQIAGVPVAVYVQRSGSTDVRGPYTAKAAPFDLSPQYASDTVKSDPNAVKSIYTTSIDLPTTGVYAVVAIAKLNGRLVATQAAGIRSAATDSVPAVGQPAPPIDTPTVASVNGNVASIDTRKPPDDMHQVNFADVYGKKPIVLLFSTPALCQSRACGPATDVVEEVSHQRPQKAAFIHMEVYRDNQIRPGCLEGTRPPGDCYRPQFLAYHLPSEPWVFGIDRHGKVAARLEGPFAKSELERLVTQTVQH